MNQGASGAAERSDANPITVGMARGYFAVQAAAGALWWVLVFASDDVRRLTLGDWNHRVLAIPDLVLFVLGSAWAATTASRRAGATVAAWTMGVTLALAISGLATGRAGWGVFTMTAASVGTVASALTLWFGRLPTQWFFRGPFSFRPARPARASGHLVRSFTQLVVFWSAFFIAVPIAVMAIEERLALSLPMLDAGAWRLVGWAAFSIGSAIGLWSCVTMALVGRGTPLPAQTAARLVVAGPYRFVRNPMAVAGALQTAAIGLVVGSWIVVVLAGAGAIAWNVLIRPVEEADLADRFGSDYEQYRADVRCWVPRRKH